VDVGVSVVVGSEEEVVLGVEALRRVSKRPGAEGAPWSVGLVVAVGWEAEGAMRRDCGGRRVRGSGLRGEKTEK
jgi:hypothetical protein